MCTCSSERRLGDLCETASRPRRHCAVHFEAPRPSWRRHVHVRITEPGGPAITKEQPLRLRAGSSQPHAESARSPSRLSHGKCYMTTGACVYQRQKNKSKTVNASCGSMMNDDTSATATTQPTHKCDHLRDFTSALYYVHSQRVLDS